MHADTVKYRFIQGLGLNIKKIKVHWGMICVISPIDWLFLPLSPRRRLSRRFITDQSRHTRTSDVKIFSASDVKDCLHISHMVIHQTRVESDWTSLKGDGEISGTDTKKTIWNTNSKWNKTKKTKHPTKEGSSVHHQEAKCNDANTLVSGIWSVFSLTLSTGHAHTEKFKWPQIQSKSAAQVSLYLNVQPHLRMSFT